MTKRFKVTKELIQEAARCMVSLPNGEYYPSKCCAITQAVKVEYPGREVVTQWGSASIYGKDYKEVTQMRLSSDASRYMQDFDSCFHFSEELGRTELIDQKKLDGLPELEFEGEVVG